MGPFWCLTLANFRMGVNVMAASKETGLVALGKTFQSPPRHYVTTLHFYYLFRPISLPLDCEFLEGIVSSVPLYDEYSISNVC